VESVYPTFLQDRPLPKGTKLLETLRRGANRRKRNHVPIISIFLLFLRSSALKVFLLFAGLF
jgi:hypothetical protein